MKHTVEWEAMKTTFHLHFRGLPAEQAKGLATQCYHRLMELEGKLSRFAEGGDVWRINHLQTGQALYISEDCHRCLLEAQEGWRLTGGLFDVTLGRAIQRIKGGSASGADEGSFSIDPEQARITCAAQGREIDLGGIGKGFALDELRRLMVDWGATGGFLRAGNSSMLGFGSVDWPVDIGGIREILRDASLSASGTEMQGNHIVHPADMGPPEHPRAWAIASTAARAEIWSTAALLMTREEIPALATTARIWIEDAGKPVEVL